MNSSVVEDTAQQLVDCLEAERQWYESFAALSQRQMRIIEDGETAELLRVLARKQQVLEKIDQVEQTLAPLKGQWPTLRDELPAERRAGVERVIDQVRDVLAEVIELERQSERRLCQRKESTLQEIERSSRGQQAPNAYGATARPTGNRYLDTTDA